MEIRFKKLIPEAKMPTKTFEPDAGFDFYCTSIVETPDYIEFHTGIALEIPDGMVGFAFPRSSVIKKDLMLKNSVGVIDATYRGEIIFMFHGTNGIKYSIGNVKQTIYGKNSYQIGDRIGQIVFMELPKITLIEAEELGDTERGSQGFGHTGK